jgi:hypothetical protein
MNTKEIKMDNDKKYLEEHHHITSSAIGLAKCRLINGDVDGTLEILKKSCDDIDSIVKLYQPMTAKIMNL